MWASFFYLAEFAIEENSKFSVILCDLTQWMWVVGVAKEGVKRKFYWKVLWVLELVSLDQSDTAMHLLGTYH